MRLSVLGHSVFIRRRRASRRWRGAVCVIGVLVAVLAMPLAPAASGTPVTARSQRACSVPASTGSPVSTTPDQVGIDAGRLRAAITFATSRLRTNVQVYRYNCLVGAAPINAATGRIPWNLWSSTKSVVSMLAGIAYGQGKLRLDAPIGTYLPAGMGDPAHRAITVRNLLTQTSGLKQSLVSEGIPAALDLDANIVSQALALPLLHTPGTFFEYGQHNGDLLAYVIGRAVGQDIQSFAQRELFAPVGIGAHDWFWNRDRSGHTYGYAFLYMPPDDFARLGLLMLDGGVWNGRAVLDPGYIEQVRTPSATNACYGYMFWLNHGPCTTPSIPSRQTNAAAPFAGMPADTYAMVGLAQQNNFILPSLGILVSWTGAFGDLSPDPITTLSGSPNSELYHSFLRMLINAVTTPRLPDPGPYRPTYNLVVDPEQFAAPSIALGAFGLGPYAPPGCDLSRCGATPLRSPFQGDPPCFAFACLPTPDAPHRP